MPAPAGARRASRAGNTKDDDCDGQTDESPTPVELRPMFVWGLIGPEATSVSGTGRIELVEGYHLWTDATAVVTAEGSSAALAAEIGWLSDEGRLRITMPLASFDLAARNPAHFRITVTAQDRADTFTGSADFIFAVLPDRVGVTFVDGALYGILPNPALRFRSGASLFIGPNYDSYGPGSEVAPGIWSLGAGGSTPVPTSYTPGVPTLLYFTTGEQATYGSEAFYTSFDPGPTAAGFTAYWGSTNTTPAALVFFELTDQDGDDQVHVSDLDEVDLYDFELGAPPR